MYVDTVWFKSEQDYSDQYFFIVNEIGYEILYWTKNDTYERYLNEFSKIFLTQDDIQNLDLEEGCKVKVSNEYGSGIYILTKSPKLKPRTALIYSGLSSTTQKGTNVNFFIPDKPEELGFSGAFNSAIIKIEKFDSKNH